MSKFSNAKGKRGEREVAKLLTSFLGMQVGRVVRNHNSEADLFGLDGWSIEVKNHATCTESERKKWWTQCALAAKKDRPLLIYKSGRGSWRAVFLWPTVPSQDFGSTCDTSLELWAELASAVMFKTSMSEPKKSEKVFND